MEPLRIHNSAETETQQTRVINILVTSTPKTIRLGGHTSIIFQNLGGGIVQASRFDGGADDFLNPSDVIELQNHSDEYVTLQVDGVDSNVRIILW